MAAWYDGQLHRPSDLIASVTEGYSISSCGCALPNGPDEFSFGVWG